jgi:hypothetical protein
MIIRVFRARCRKGKVRDLENFLGTFALPILKKQKGCSYAATGKKLGRPEILVLTVWNDLESLMRFTGKRWKQPVVHPKEAPFIDGKPTVDHFEGF